jgi:hypothetical protein
MHDVVLHVMKRPTTEAPMEPILSVNNPPDVSTEQRTSVELLKRIRKLRWIGEEDDALRRNSASEPNRGETMEVNTLGAGIALAVTLALISGLCALAFVIAPDSTLDFFSAFMHGLDLKSVKAAAPLSFGRVLYGMIGLSIVGFIVGFVFAWTYNVINRQ